MFCIIFPTFLRTSISSEFIWSFIDWVSAGFFSRCIFSFAEEIKIAKKACKKYSSKLSQKYPSIYSFKRKCNFCNLDNSFRKITWFVLTHILGRVSLRCFFWLALFRIWPLTWLSFLLWWYLYFKIWIKPLVSRRSISHCLFCVPFFILTLQGLGRRFRWIKLLFALKLLFCLAGNFITFSKTYSEIFW